MPFASIGHTCPLIFSAKDPKSISLLQINLNSFAFDYIARQKVGGTHLTYNYLKQLPILRQDEYPNLFLSKNESIIFWLFDRFIELIYTSWDLEPLAKDCDYDGPPFKWDEERRVLIRCEIDAAYFHLYGIERDDVDYIMETFPIVKRKDEKKYGEYRTKRQILEIYDAMADSIRTGTPYPTLLDPPPADPRVAHPPRGE